MENTKRKYRRFEGVVVSNKMSKTIVVRVDREKIHPKYGKRYTMSRNFKVHDETNEAKVGERVLFEECRPLSRDKRCCLVSILVKK